MIFSIANLVYELPHELPSNLRLRILGNIRKISNLGADIAQCPVSLPEIKLWQQQSKNIQKQISNFSCPVQFYWISLFCSKYFAQDYRQFPGKTDDKIFQKIQKRHYFETFVTFWSNLGKCVNFPEKKTQFLNIPISYYRAKNQKNLNIHF